MRSGDWLARHETLKDQRVLKFCFRADRVRSLKREASIFRLLRQRAGNHPGIVTVHDLYLDEPPYYLVMDYVPGRDLKSWCARQSGLNAVPMGVRLSLVADVAEALHSLKRWTNTPSIPLSFNGASAHEDALPPA